MAGLVLFLPRKLWYGGCCMAVVLSSHDIERYKADGQELEVFWRSETPVGPHSRGSCLSRRWDYLWIMPIRSLPTAMRLRHRGRVLPLSPQQRRGPPI